MELDGARAEVCGDLAAGTGVPVGASDDGDVAGGRKAPALPWMAKRFRREDVGAAGVQYAPGVRTEFEGFCVEFESFNPTTRIVRVRSAVGTFSATWMGNEPRCGDQSSVEFSTEPTAVWGVDVTEASPDEPDAILEDAEGWTFVGRVLGVEPGIPHYADGGRVIPAHDLVTGVFYLRIGESVVMLDADGLPADAAGRRVRVRQTRVELFPQ